MSYVRKIHKTIEQCLIPQFPTAVLDNVLLSYVDKSTIIVCLFTRNDSARIENALNSISRFADCICLLDIESHDNTLSKAQQWQMKNECKCILDIKLGSGEEFYLHSGFAHTRNLLLLQSKQLAAFMELNLDSTYVCWLHSDILWKERDCPRADNQSTPRKDREHFEQVKWRLTDPAYKVTWNGSVWNRLESGLLVCLSLNNTHWIDEENLFPVNKSVPLFEMDFQ